MDEPPLVPSIHERELRSLIRTVSVGEPCLIIGEAGSGKTTLANRAIDELEDKHCCLAQYIIGSSKQTLIQIALSFHVPTSEPKYNSKGEETGERKLTAEDLRQEILDNARTSWVLFCDDADLWPSSLRLWLCQLIAKGVCVVLLAKTKLRKDVFLKAIAIELFALSSLWEGLGRAMTEAMLVGKPVVVPNIYGIPEIVKHEETGLLFPAKDVNQLASHLIDLLQHPQKREYLGQNAKKLTRKLFDADIMVQDIEQTYEKLLNQKFL